MVVADGDLLILLQHTTLDASNGDAPHELVIVDGGHQHLEGLIQIRLRGGDVAEDGVEQGLEIRAGDVGGVGCNVLSAFGGMGTLSSIPNSRLSVPLKIKYPIFFTLLTPFQLVLLSMPIYMQYLQYHHHYVFLLYL